MEKDEVTRQQSNESSRLEDLELLNVEERRSHGNITKLLGDHSRVMST